MNPRLETVTAQSIQQNPEDWCKRLKEARDELPNLDARIATSIFREFLEACGPEGITKLDKRAVREILFHLAWIAKNRFDVCYPLLQSREIALQVLDRPDMNQGWQEVSDLRTLLGHETRDSNVNDLFSALMSRLSLEAWSLVERLVTTGNSDSEDISSKWNEGRSVIKDRQLMHEVDLALLDQALQLSAPLAVQFVKTLFNDDDFWAEPSVQDWAKTKATPLDEDVFGSVESAMINTRLRSIIPRAFLRRPMALVIDCVANAGNVASIQTMMSDDLAIQILDAIVQLDSNLAGKSTSKRTVRVVRDGFESYLHRLSVRLLGNAQDEDEFDPVKHQGLTPILKGMAVTILKPGLISATDGRVLERAIVVLSGESPNQEGSMK